VLKRIVEIPLDGSGSMILAEVDADEHESDAFVPATNVGEVVERFGGSVQSALDTTIRPTAMMMMGLLHG
jgi:hypothetical protein